jgi:hypothetical protein
MSHLIPVAIPVTAICRRAYEIWQREGTASDKSLEHWLRAENELQSEADFSRAVSSKSSEIPASIYFWDFHG